MEKVMEIIAGLLLVAVWFYSEEVVGFLQLDRANRMADRKLDRLENEQVIGDVQYYSSKEMPSDELVKKAAEQKARLAKYRSL